MAELAVAWIGVLMVKRERFEKLRQKFEAEMELCLSSCGARGFEDFEQILGTARLHCDPHPMPLTKQQKEELRRLHKRFVRERVSADE